MILRYDFLSGRNHLGALRCLLAAVSRLVLSAALPVAPFFLHDKLIERGADPVETHEVLRLVFATLPLGAVAYATALREYSWAKRYALLGAEGVGSWDSRPPVVLLRSFRDDLTWLRVRRRCLSRTF